MPGRGWSRAYCRGVAGLGGAGAWPPAGLMPSSAILVCTVGAWVPVGLLSGLVVSHPVRGSVGVVGVDQVIKGH